MSLTPYKQVILIRRDLKMRRGKEIAQGSHASMAFVADVLRKQLQSGVEGPLSIVLSEEEKAWLTIGVAKICLQVSSEAELLEMHQKALSAGLKSHLIRDSGKTEFGGVPTFTACAIGPHASEKIDAVTGSLTLY